MSPSRKRWLAISNIYIYITENYPVANQKRRHTSTARHPIATPQSIPSPGSTKILNQTIPSLYKMSADWNIMKYYVYEKTSLSQCLSLVCWNRDSGHIGFHYDAQPDYSKLFYCICADPTRWYQFSSYIFAAPSTLIQTPWLYKVILP